MPISFQDAIVRTGGIETDVPLLLNTKSWSRQFLVRQPQSLDRLSPLSTDNATQPFLVKEEDTVRGDALVRLPILRQSDWKARVLQRWTGRVEFVGAETFTAVITDTLDSTKPLEEVELSTGEVSPSDLPLLTEGSLFYWTIGYRDSPGGQRGRISELRFARRAPLDKEALAQAIERANLFACLLESD
jgi:hypothetical protein